MGKQNNRLYTQIPALKREGFTLIELLIVIGVLGVLASVLVIVINPAKQLQKARDVKRKANIAQIQQALELYRSSVGNYPNQMNTCGPTVNLESGSVSFLRGIPCDPNGSPYLYTPETGSPVVRYRIRACLEIATDPEADPGNTCSSPLVSFTRFSP